MAKPSRQTEVYAALLAYWQRNGYAPTLREIGEQLGLSPSSVFYYVGKLEAAGLVQYNARQRERALMIVRAQ
jgi:DNA-binding MarR family transcriptional regulator